MLARRMFRAGAVAALLITAAACSGGSSGAAPADTSTATASTAVDPAPTTEAPTPTEAPTTTEPATTTTVPAPTWPLTGLPAADEILALRPAIAVKLDNHKDARPHAGLNQADIVYEEIVEAQITRFFAIFHSTDAAPIGPVRSARNTDVDLLNQLGRPLFIWSGGNRGVVEAIGQADAVSMAAGQDSSLYYRDKERHRRAAIEHTLLAYGTQDIWQHIVDGQRVPAAFFTYRSADQAVEGDDMPMFQLDMRSVHVTWAWDAASATWQRTEYDAPHTDITGAPISTNNVIVQFIEYGISPVDARSPQGYTVGEGDALVFSEGKVILARWSRPSADAPATFTDAAGQPILLTPGRTWVELAESGVSTVAPL